MSSVVARRNGTGELAGTVCAVLGEVGPGSVVTYGDIARRIGISPRRAGREVGGVPDEVPWWRVVRADGLPAACRGGRAAELLRAEGVPLRNGRVELARVRHTWHAPLSDTPQVVRADGQGLD